MKWEETLPIGNGSLGAMIWGDAKKECLGLNEESLWSGYYHDKNNNKAFEHLKECRRLVEGEEFEQAEKVIRENMLGEYNESYMPLGNLYFTFNHGEEIKNYKRSLDLEHSVSKVSYQVGEHKYTREYFASYPAKAIFIKLQCDSPALNFKVSFESEMSSETTYSLDGLKITGVCPEHVDPSYINVNETPVIQGDKGMKFHAELNILTCDGTIEKEEQSINVSNASTVILVFSAVKEPEYNPSMFYDEIKEIHIKDYRALYEKVELYLGEDNDLPTDERLERLRKGEEDNSLYVLFFQYGRYLLISSSRQGSLPANLQGIWSWQFRAPWSCNWTTNINAQMNYWLAQSCNLKECLPPYFELVNKLCEEGKKTAKVHYNCRGFVHHHNADYWCNTNPVGVVYGEDHGKEESVTWSMWPMGGAWLTSELFRHYEYNPDESFLKNTVYPVLKESAMFLIDWLYEYEGSYVTCPSTSPEINLKRHRVLLVPWLCLLPWTLLLSGKCLGISRKPVSF